MSDLMNELISDEAVYRTALATPGLLISQKPIYTFSQIRVEKQRFLSELLVYLKNCSPKLVLLFLTMV